MMAASSSNSSGDGSPLHPSSGLSAEVPWSRAAGGGMGVRKAVLVDLRATRH